MNIEIKGTGSHNKGAEMMLLTILQELRDNNTNKFSIAPSFYGVSYEFYSALGLYPKFWYTFKNIQLGIFGKFIPKKLRRLFGIIIDKEIDLILDASGFAYSSQWGIYPTMKMAKESKKWKKQKKQILLMPQAFGPFEDEKIKKYMQEIIENVNRIYARDQFSYQELLKIKDDKTVIKLSPDFTTLFKGRIPNYFNKNLHQVCIVPNKRMKDKIKDNNNYERFFSEIITILQKNNLSPYFLIHGGEEDNALAEKINSLLTNKILILNEENPFYIKGLIENSLGLVGSRFHSLASSLYSSVPTLGIGWSHKYEYLFKEVNYEEGLLKNDTNNKELIEKLELITNTEKRKKSKTKLSNAVEVLKSKNKKLFEEIKKDFGIN